MGKVKLCDCGMPRTKKNGNCSDGEKKNRINLFMSEREQRPQQTHDCRQRCTKKLFPPTTVNHPVWVLYPRYCWNAREFLSLDHIVAGERNATPNEPYMYEV